MANRSSANHHEEGGRLGWVAWVLASLGLVMVLPVRLRLGHAFGGLPLEQFPLVLAMGLGYLAAVALTGASRAGGWPPLLAGPAGFGIAYGALLLGPDVQASRAVVLLSAALGTGLLLLSARLGPGTRILASVGAAAGVGALLVTGTGTPASPSSPVPNRGSANLSGLHGFRLTPVPAPGLSGRRGGGLVRAGPLLVMADGTGALGVLDPAAPVPAWRRIDVPSPVDAAALVAVAGRDDHAARFRAMDLALRPDGAGWELFLSHHVFHADPACFAVRLSRLRLAPGLEAARPGEVWETVFEARPCLPYLRGEGDTPTFRGNDSGGRLEWLGPDLLLLTVGHHMVPGVAGDRGSDYGKTIAVDLSGPEARARHFTTGHRNPQGLLVAGSVVWSTEHGPQGGDELNLLVEGRDYGWDRTSLGTDYGSLEFEGEVVSDEPVEDPVYAWMPSVGVSDLVRVEGRAFHRWRGDLLVASLRAGTLFRLRLGEGRVVYAEPIPIGQRIRALVEDEAGAFWLRTDGPDVLRLEIDDEGARAWGACASCHALVEDPTRVGPDLGDLAGRPVASRPGFDYSPALRALGGVWTRDRLDAFLADPHRFAPGTTMEMDPVTDPEVRARILDHLEAADRR